VAGDDCFAADAAAMDAAAAAAMLDTAVSAPF